MASSQFLRRIFPVVLGAALFGLGIYALYHLLRPVSPAEIMAQVRAMPATVLLAALAATVVGYVAMIAYDALALRFIRRRLPFGVVVLGGYLGYAFGNTIGVSAISGGAVRYRIYSASGLNGFEVATVSGYIAIAVGVGLTLVGLTALAIHPGAVDALLPSRPGTIRLAAGLIVIVSVTAIIWASVRQHSLRIWGYDLHLPPPADLAGQLVITLIDIAAASFALWVLLPAGKPDFPTFVAIYSAATMIGVISHVPGGIGVFETVVIGALPSSVPVGETAAALLLFRMIYYLLPFALGFLIAAMNEARAAGGVISRMMGQLPSQVQPALSALHGMVPGLVAAVTFGLGTYLLLVTMVPAMRADALADGDLVATLMLEGGTLATGIAGLSLLVLSHGLARRVSSAYLTTLAMLAIAALASLANDLDVENAGLLGLASLSLVPFWRAFDRTGPLTEGVFGPRWFALIGAVVLATAAVFFFSHKTVPYSNDLWIDFTRSAGTPRALRAGLLVSVLLFLFCLHLLTRPVRTTVPDTTQAALGDARAILAQAQDPQSWLSQTGDKRFLFSEAGDAFLMYGTRRASWVAFGDPVGNPAAFEALIWEFAERAEAAGCRPVFYEISARHLPLWVEQGHILHKIGEEAVVSLAEFSLQGSRFKTMRAAQNKRIRDGYEFEVLPPPHADPLMDELGAISLAWLGGKAGAEKGFSVGRFDPAYLAHFDIAVIRKDGRIIAFANIMAAGGGQALAVDLMRYLPEEASGIMEFMFLRLIEHYRDAGATEFSLGTAPLAGLSERTVARSWIRFGRMIYRHGGMFYNFEGLRAFKQKFQPEWRPRYLALPPGRSPLIAMSDVAVLIAGSTRGLIAR